MPLLLSSFTDAYVCTSTLAPTHEVETDTLRIEIILRAHEQRNRTVATRLYHWGLRQDQHKCQ